ncbi:MAG: 16S rRNA (guanine(527)-N(7))-methyltransferase RsmG [Candidatus Hydrogenedens sp.]
MSLNIELYKKRIPFYPIDWEEWQTEISQYISLLKEWNPLLNLVSKNDLEKNCISHIEDSLSLIPYIYNKMNNYKENLWLDIGTGGGFPAIPILLTKKDFPTLLIERKSKKVGFLQMLISRFKLKNTKVVCDIFPECLDHINIQIENIGVITSRGIEKPEKMALFLKQWLPQKTWLLCQTPHLEQIFDSEIFQKEIIQDEFTTINMRRGKLVIIHRK